MRHLLAAALLAVTGSCLAGDYDERPEFKAVVDELVEKHALDRAEVTALLATAQRRQPILDAIARPAEKALPWSEYRPRFIEPKRIEQGLAFWREHEKTLDRAEHKYGVPQEMIVAIIGVETRYGRNKGSYRVIDALATLAFDYPPRSPFFTSELKHFVQLGKSAHIDPATTLGSYAGAMGFPQFMPSSYRNFAVDFDHDDVTDLVNNPVDAIGSVGNYFRKHGWEPGEPVAARALVSGDAYEAVLNQGLDLNHTVKSLAEAGVAVLSCKTADDAPAPQWCADPSRKEKAAAWKLAGDQGAEFWVGFNNFYVITRYNRSEMYSLAVLQLAHELRTARTKAQAAATAGTQE